MAHARACVVWHRHHCWARKIERKFPPIGASSTFQIPTFTHRLFLDVLWQIPPVSARRNHCQIFQLSRAKIHHRWIRVFKPVSYNIAKGSERRKVVGGAIAEIRRRECRINVKSRANAKQTLSNLWSAVIDGVDEIAIDTVADAFKPMDY